MPTITQWCPPAVFLKHNGVTVYCVYKNDDVDQGRQEFKFTTHDADDEGQFDIREDLKVSSLSRLDEHPPFLSMTDARFAAATPEQRAQWKLDWEAWHAEGGGRHQAVTAILKEGIDLGLIVAPVES